MDLPRKVDEFCGGQLSLSLALLGYPENLQVTVVCVLWSAV